MSKPGPKAVPAAQAQAARDEENRRTLEWIAAQAKEAKAS